MAEVKFGPLYSRIHELVGVNEVADTTVLMGFDSIWIPDTMVTREHALDCMPDARGVRGAYRADHAGHVRGGRTPQTPCHPCQGGRDPRLPVGRQDHLWRWRGPEGESRISRRRVSISRERGARTDEALEIMTGLWSDEPFSHKGQVLRVRGHVHGAQARAEAGASNMVRWSFGRAR